MTKESREFARKDYEGLSKAGREFLQRRRSYLAKDMNTLRNAGNKYMIDHISKNNEILKSGTLSAKEVNKLLESNKFERTLRDMFHQGDLNTSKIHKADFRKAAEYISNSYPDKPKLSDRIKHAIVGLFKQVNYKMTEKLRYYSHNKFEGTYMGTKILNYDI